MSAERRRLGVDFRLQVLLVGVGGQGVITAAKILGEAAHAAGFNVVVGQLHGMSQRGGTVECPVLIGPGESSFILGAVDALVAFEPLEALRALPNVGASTRVVMNSGVIAPPSSVGRALAGAKGALPAPPAVPSPEDAAARLAELAAAVTLVDGPLLLQTLTERRTLNLVMLGALAATELLPFPAQTLLSAASRMVSERYREVNARAFMAGHDWVARGDGAGAAAREAPRWETPR